MALFRWGSLANSRGYTDIPLSVADSSLFLPEALIEEITNLLDRDLVPLSDEIRRRRNSPTHIVENFSTLTPLSPETICKPSLSSASSQSQQSTYSTTFPEPAGLQHSPISSKLYVFTSCDRATNTYRALLTSLV